MRMVCGESSLATGVRLADAGGEAGERTGGEAEHPVVAAVLMCLRCPCSVSLLARHFAVTSNG
jgi:hypothetical protein